MAALSSFKVIKPGAAGSVATRLMPRVRWMPRVALTCAALAPAVARGLSAAAQIAVFLWTALVAAFFGLITAGFLC